MNPIKLLYNKFFKKNKSILDNTFESGSIDECLDVFKLIDPSKGLSTHELFSKQIFVLYPNIEAYITGINLLKIKFESGIAIKSEDIPYDIYPILLENFFISKDKYYLDINDYLTILQKVVIELCKISKRVDSTITYSHNKRVTTTIITNLIPIGKTIVDCQKIH